MIHLFNRKELMTTFSLEKQGKVREILADNGIEYRIRARSNTGGISRSRTVLSGFKMEMAYQYDIYVKREDFEKAQYLIR